MIKDRVFPGYSKIKQEWIDYLKILKSLILKKMYDFSFF